MVGSVFSYFVGKLSFDRKRIMVVVPEEEAPIFYREISTFSKCLFLPSWDVEPESGLLPSTKVLKERLNTFVEVINSHNFVVVVTPSGYVQRIPEPESVIDSLEVVVKGGRIERDSFSERLLELGYNPVNLVEDVGGFSVRGDVIDVFPINEALPVRIELWGDEVESIRRFHPDTQRSIEEMGSVTIFPAREPPGVRWIDEIVGFDCYVVFDPETVKIQLEEACVWTHEDRHLPKAHFEIRPFERPFKALASIVCDAPLRGERRLRYAIEEIKGYLKRGYTGFIVVDTRERADSLKDILFDYGLGATVSRFKRALVRSGLYIITGFLREGFLLEDDKVFFIPEHELFGKRKISPKKPRKRVISTLDVTSIGVGDYVIHKDHGVGRFLGFKKTEVGGILREFLAIEYRDGDILYVPVERMNLVQKYVGAEATPPRIDKLGGVTWRRARERVKKSVERFVKELLELEAKRRLAKGHAFSPDTPWQREFEESFPYEETPDQIRVTEEVKADMESEKPMDRLVCGDVGFGKTEIAMRAAFKAVMDGKQVAVFVPTTILAEQHYETFRERFKDYPVEIEVLSRFRSKKEQQDIVKRLAEGKIDIIIGTHRLLSKDVKFRDLGLVIIDEEHKFGVAHKERFKSMKANVDILMLSATPIPRTLHMALSGLKDMSVMETPPEGRHPVKTFVTTFKKETLKIAMERELKRGGRVFVVQNRIEGLDLLANTIKSMFPAARIEIAHGKMPSAELERIMYAFFKKEVDILVSTAIVESGLDVPSANTLIVVGAEKFGLSQLYQLRGRVGRGKEMAYAYFLVTPGLLTTEARRRLRALQEFSEVGSGLRLALRDMEIRGVGNILGKEQSGNVADVGLEEYFNILEETVRRLKGERVEVEIEPSITVRFDAYIPDYYINDDSLKLFLYKRLASSTLEELKEIEEEIKDRFGQPPREVQGLFLVSKLKVLCKIFGIEKVVERTKDVLIEAVSLNVKCKKLVDKGAGKYVFLGKIEELVDVLLNSVEIATVEKA